MRRLVKYLIFAALAWSALWYAGARGIEAGLPRGLEALRAEGWTAEAVLGEVSGFPGRFETALSGIQVTHPRRGFAWRAPEVAISARSWNPLDLTADWPAEQAITAAGQRLTLGAERARTRVVLIPGATLAFHRATAEVAAGALASSAGWRAAVAEARIDAARLTDRPFHYDLTLELKGIAPPDAFVALADPEGRLPPVVDHLALDATVGFDAALNRFTLERRPQPTALDLRGLTALWGGLEIAAAGNLTFDADGLASGRVTLSTARWRDALAWAIAAGLVDPESEGAYENGLALFAAASGEAGKLELPLSLRDGFLSLGLIPLGPVPPLRLP